MDYEDYELGTKEQDWTSLREPELKVMKGRGEVLSVRPEGRGCNQTAI